MKTTVYIIISIMIHLNLAFTACSQTDDKMKKEIKTQIYNPLTPEEEQVIIHKGTEKPFTGKYNQHEAFGLYTCKRCGAALYRSQDKFDAGCGWPSFDDELPGAVSRETDADGIRTEILCQNCGGHLGHVFLNEGFTRKNTRHCVNSVSMDFIAATQQDYPRALFASGCFWGTEYFLQKAEGVVSTTVGYTGGDKEQPTYKEVCGGQTGHAETVEVIFDPKKTSYEALARLFFETHDFTQVNRQGPDIGEQYRSAIFYSNEHQKAVAKRLVKKLEDQGYKVATEITPVSKFWAAEDYHQDYYQHKGSSPYCHVYRKIFD